MLYKGIIYLAIRWSLYWTIQDCPFNLRATEIVFMDGLIIGIEVDLSLVELLSGKNIFQYHNEIAEHFAVKGLLTHVHEKDHHIFRRSIVINAKSKMIYPVGPSTR